MLQLRIASKNLSRTWSRSQQKPNSVCLRAIHATANALLKIVIISSLSQCTTKDISCISTVQHCSDTHTVRGQVALMKILQSHRKVSEAGKVTVSSVLLITLFEERLGTWTCDTFFLGLLEWRSQINDRLYACACVLVSLLDTVIY